MDDKIEKYEKLPLPDVKREMKSRPTSVLSKRSNLSVAPSFQATHRAAPILDTLGLMTEYRGGVNAPRITIHNTTNLPQMRIRQKAKMQKKDILEWLSEENPPPSILLERLAECTTPYAKLFRLMAQELGCVTSHISSEQIDQLARESQLGCAKMEVETQQQQEKLVKLQTENSDLQQKIDAQRAILNGLNGDIDRMHMLLSDSEDRRRQQRMEEMRDWDEPTVKSEDVADLDKEEYDKLWVEQNELMSQLQGLETELRKKQVQQVVEIRELVKRKNPQYMTMM